MTRFSIRTDSPQCFVNITREVARIVSESGVDEGMCFVFNPHTTAGLTINEAADPDVVSDMLRELGKIVPLRDGYDHAEGNSAAHIKASMMGSSLSIPVSGGQLVLGTWQGLYCCEFDGPRQRSVIVQVTGIAP